MQELEEKLQHHFNLVENLRGAEEASLDECFRVYLGLSKMKKCETHWHNNIEHRLGKVKKIMDNCDGRIGRLLLRELESIRAIEEVGKEEYSRLKQQLNDSLKREQHRVSRRGFARACSAH